MKFKPKMPVSKRRVSRNSHASKTGSGHQGHYVGTENEQKPLSPAIRRSAINNLVGNPSYSSTPSTEESKYSLRTDALPDMKGGPAPMVQSNKNSPENNKRFNMRVGSLNQSSNEGTAAGSGQMIVGGMSKSNPLSHREKSGMKDPMIKKYNKINEP